MYNNSRRFGGYNNHSHRPSFGGRPKRAGFAKKIDERLFVKKAEEFKTIDEAVTVNSFADFGLNPVLQKNIVGKGYTKPTPIQDRVIPEIMAGKDVLGIANTGTGKTAAFALPLINKILQKPNTRILIMAPTRELAQQIKQDFRSFTYDLKIYIALAIGGSFIREQIMDIRRDPHIVVGTPGRIMDLAERRVINFAKFDTVVLDEVDRMLDMGFVEDIKGIMQQIPKTRQTLFFSATVDRKIETLIDTFLTNPAKISVKTQDTSSHVEQDVVRVARGQKESKLCDLLTQEHFKKVLVFGATKMMVDRITTTLIQRGFRADSIHGNKAQNKRQRVLQAFKLSQINILVATDVAARGLDIADISHVINYDQPNNYEDYIHRIGRTGRGDAKGFALTFVEERY
ncbi:DEAD/DEAH box helicase [Candidatus Shapirobacteria bacterium]|nr:DEAD/DEAH box helicase [Candidatus Shapirobacteria bacterium]